MRIKPQLTKKSTGRYFYFPSVIIISVLVFFPMLQALMMSFQTGSPVDMQFSGLSNYIRMLSDATFKKAALNTSLYLLVQVPVMILLSMVISVLLNQKNLKFRSFFRIAIFLPCITSLVSY